jgi:hypothetical protein
MEMSKLSDLISCFSTEDSHPNTACTSPARPWWVGWPLLLVTALFILPIAGSPTATNPNEVIRVELAVAIAFWAQLDLGPAAEIYGLSEDFSVRDGKIYSDKAPGLSIASVPLVWIVDPVLSRSPTTDLPAYWPLRHVLTLFLISLPTVGLAFLVGAAIPSADPRQRVAAAVVAALATPLWTYGTVFFGHAAAALSITLAWFLLLGFPARTISLDRRRAALGGIAAGFAVATEYPTILIVAVIFGSLLVRRASLPIFAIAAGAAFAGALPAMIYHQIAFGAPWITGYSFKAATDFQAIIDHGVFGLSWPSAEALGGVLFGSRRGIMFYSPVLLLTPIGLWWLARRHGWRDAGPILIAIVCYVLFAASFVDWPAGWCAAARHLVPIVPLAVVVALFAVTQLTAQRWSAAIVVMMIAVSGTHTVLTIVLTPFFPPEFGAPLGQLVLPSLADGAGFANILSSVFGVAPTSIVVLTGVIAAGFLIWASNRLVGDRGWWPAPVSVTIIAVLLLVLNWQASSAPADTELMRAQMLRRLNHTEIADRIEGAIVSPSAPR